MVGVSFLTFSDCFAKAVDSAYPASLMACVGVLPSTNALMNFLSRNDRFFYVSFPLAVIPVSRLLVAVPR